MLAPTQQTTQTWPTTGDVADLRQIITDQAATMAANAALIDAYQSDLHSAQNPPPGVAATGTGTATGTSLVVSNHAGPSIVNGSVVTDGALVPAGTVILGQISGATAGGNGTYLTNNPTTANATPLTFTPPPPTGTWPQPNDPVTLMLIVQEQLTVLRQQTALLQGYQDLLNTSATPPPPTGP